MIPALQRDEERLQLFGVLHIFGVKALQDTDLLLSFPRASLGELDRRRLAVGDCGHVLACPAVLGILCILERMALLPSKVSVL